MPTSARFCSPGYCPTVVDAAAAVAAPSLSVEVPAGLEDCLWHGLGAKTREIILSSFAVATNCCRQIRELHSLSCFSISIRAERISPLSHIIRHCVKRQHDFGGAKFDAQNNVDLVRFTVFIRD